MDPKGRPAACGHDLIFSRDRGLYFQYKANAVHNANLYAHITTPWHTTTRYSHQHIKVADEKYLGELGVAVAAGI